MIYTYEKFDNNLSIFNKILRQNIITNINDIQEEYKEHYNNTKSQITYTQSYLDSQLNTDIMKFFYSDEDIQSFYNKYTILN